MEDGRFMKKLSIYIDTSVVGGCFDEVFKDFSVAFFDMAKCGDIFLLVSDIMIAELAGAPTHVQNILESIPGDFIEEVESTTESTFLRDCYLDAGVVSQKSRVDAYHVALATVNQADVIISWNFKHIVHLDKIKGFNSINLREGYKTLEIRSPLEVIPYG